jgi:hypothetical protein
MAAYAPPISDKTRAPRFSEGIEQVSTDDAARSRR